MNNNKTWQPLGVAVAIAFFIYFGARLEDLRLKQEGDLANLMRPSGVPLTSGAMQKMNTMFHLLENEYVDSLNVDDLLEQAIPTLIGELDPHSVYIPAKDLESTNEQLNGSFSGIGVQFNIQNDTVMVIGVISGGPSEKVGLMPGDRIVTVDDSTFTGKGITNEKVFSKLRGEKGTTVRVGVRRSSADEELKFDIVRGDIPLISVNASYLIRPNIGYLKIDNFGRNTYNEFFTALMNLKRAGAQGYIVDLRANSGGYMDICYQMVNEFLKRGAMVVYTEGLHSEREELRADGRGNFQEAPIVVLIDEWSASASEIFAGAIQDNDRGTIIGRRSFGKGLVQRQFELGDGSALRLTTARYHIPSGRCIQKAYQMGDGADYERDLMERYDRGEFYSKDSIHLADTVPYTTVMGRTVYGGGGIMPDVFIPVDTTGTSPYSTRVINLGLPYAFAFRYADAHREQLKAFTDFDAMHAFLKQQQLLPEFVKFAADKVKPVPAQVNAASAYLERLLIAYVMRQVKDDNFFYQEFYGDDKVYNEAISILNAGKAYPVK
jgi:carboxyl-terminal processing protease